MNNNINNNIISLLEQTNLNLLILLIIIIISEYKYNNYPKIGSKLFRANKKNDLFKYYIKYKFFFTLIIPTTCINNLLFNYQI